ncbi:thiol-disulfide oxidoreductase DCC family protein [Pseudalkalibacillus salsuginis]|uniref:thiol-disulfide oxidoreductase DCC family protein n=1 Tax=Pseudalkalibacillus salsuginis TaxID=2910972 RepID=UPI001F303420|nr:thiol-disulfide oxidoreductase DCC family protein [Pseudalkalibacillus salsuginis]MCF6410166.1 thiol-disulfide oxidoreductase DCC family protein [Pseudalkalibacillus salsuginis]
MSRILLFDGECNLCNGIVQFVIKRDPNTKFQFAALQSETGQKLLKEYDLPNQFDSFIMIEGGKAYQKSSAALRVVSHLNGGWRLFTVFKIIPTPIRDVIYNFIARNRYKWFGKRDSCMIPTPDIKSRFLD